MSYIADIEHTQDTSIWVFYPPLEHDMPGPSEPTVPSEEATPAEQTMPHERLHSRG
ncbi:hypothetical protein CK203_049506 [Vitis vinifera]|uniref:Uncharacterized protein n=1 Tax=Vitis vinifera TaxID=29760 RepID=A0A438HBD7_VITVI|nr:hypothetical protein CK203_049506 [Vitis vinifera]